MRAGRWTTIGCLVALVALAGACAPAGPRDVVIDPSRARAPGPNPSAGCEAATGPAPGRSTVVVEGRAALRTIPASYRPGERAPLLVSLHPFTLGPDAWEHYSGLASAAAGRGYVVLTPLGSDPGPRWSVPGGLGGPFDVDDVGWVNRLVDATTDELCVDQNRVVAAGFSAGAAMAVALGCAAPQRFGAIAASGGANLTDPCPGTPPVDAIVLHGSADPIAPTSGSQVPFAPPLGLSVEEAVASLAERAGCDPVPVAEPAANTVTVDRYGSCGDRRVEYWRLLGAGHTWAGAAGIGGLPLAVADLIVGPTNVDIVANDVVLDFLDAVPAP